MFEWRVVCVPFVAHALLVAGARIDASSIANLGSSWTNFPRVVALVPRLAEEWQRSKKASAAAEAAERYANRVQRHGRDKEGEGLARESLHSPTRRASDYGGRGGHVEDVFRPTPTQLR